MNALLHFFDKFEDHVRHFLSHYPLVYSLIGGSAVILFWRGVWKVADLLEKTGGELGALVFSGVGSMVLGVVILMATGLFVSVFIGDSIIMSGIKKDKKLIEKTEIEIADETFNIKKVETELETINQKLDEHDKKVCKVM